MTVLETIRDLQAEDEASARVLLELALYEATCDEVDRVRPQLEAEVSKALAEKAGQGLVYLARQPVSKASIEVADALIDLVELSKRDNDWDERLHPRDQAGQFAPKNGRIRRGILNALGFATGGKNEDPEVQRLAHGALGSWAGPEASNYSRLRSLGQGLVSTNDPNARPAGTVLRLMGDIGPEAQKHLEPGIRRTAYRYRGTERRPDQRVQAQMNAILVGTPDEPSELQGRGKDRERLQVASELGVAQLVHQIPDKDTAAISLAAGKMPPSVGLMFDGKSRLVSEAMGFNGDHYLPFDLRNLKRLHGGSYVRTRTTGGLTDEDIYTGLMTGARHVTVVSNSGVFTLEFDKDLRGGRRYSDKARQMVDRYARLVGAIGSGQLYQNQLPPETVSQLRKDALKASGNNVEQAKVIFQRRLHEAQEAAAFLGQSDDDLMENAVKLVDAKQKGLSNQARSRAIRDTFHELRDDEAKTAARKYRLDGQGYKAAMEALKTEFPYFVRDVEVTPLKQYMSLHNLEDPKSGAPRGGTDMGYTPRGGVDPDKAGIKDVTDTEGKRRVILGAPRKPKGHAEPEGSTPAASGGSGGGGGGGTGTAVIPGNRPQGGGGGGAAADLPTALKEAAVEKGRDLGESLSLSLAARTQVDNEAWIDPFDDDDDKKILGRSGQAWAKWAYDNHGKNWQKVAQWLSGDADVKHVDAALQALDQVQTAIGHDPNATASFSSFDKAKKDLTALRRLKQPFREGAFDPHLEPQLGENDPQAVPDVVALGTDVEKIKAYVDADHDGAAVDKAGEWARESKTDEAIRTEVAQAAATLRKLKELAVNPNANVIGLEKTDPKVIEQVANLKDMGDNAPEAKQVETLHRAWALLRLHQVVGSLSGSGDAVPFAQPEGTPGEVAMRDSTPSRLVRHSPDSEVAKAVRSALSPPPLLRPVRLPASR